MGRTNILVFILLTVIVIVVFLLWTNNTKPQETNIPNQPAIIQPTNSQNNVYSNLCSNYQSVDGEISCEEAIDIVLQKHPGKVEYVKKEETSYRIPPLYKERAKKEMWIFGMTLDNPYYLRSPEIPDYTIEVFVDKSDGIIRMVGDRTE
ncbi:MAG: hypothetical protein HYT07_03570 [Candidatus Levybacteria bacterium]|nr:hypothetical protein [Candidatus Levybacteria bacterium]